MMQTKELERLLHIGLGRAVLLAQENDLTPYRDLILHACLDNTSYDPQCEGSRAAYMFDIIRLTGEEQFYRQQILTTLARSESSGDWDEHQLFDFAALFARNGDTAAREVMYEKFVKNAAQDSSTGAEALDEDELHAIGARLLDVVDAHPSYDAVRALTAIYEQGPCSECREDFVDCLLSLDALPDWMRGECRYDANLDLREKMSLTSNPAQ